MESMMDSTKCKSFILKGNSYKETLKEAYQHSVSENSPVFLAVGKEFFGKYGMTTAKVNPYELNREQALELVLKTLGDGVFVGTTGFLSRELHELRSKLNQK